jgi:hypothetical protein
MAPPFGTAMMPARRRCPAWQRTQAPHFTSATASASASVSVYHLFSCRRPWMITHPPAVTGAGEDKISQWHFLGQVPEQSSSDTELMLTVLVRPSGTADPGLVSSKADEFRPTLVQGISLFALALSVSPAFSFFLPIHPGRRSFRPTSLPLQLFNRLTD